MGQGHGTCPTKAVGQTFTPLAPHPPPPTGGHDLPSHPYLVSRPVSFPYSSTSFPLEHFLMIHFHLNPCLSIWLLWNSAGKTKMAELGLKHNSCKADALKSLISAAFSARGRGEGNNLTCLSWVLLPAHPWGSSEDQARPPGQPLLPSLGVLPWTRCALRQSKLLL